MLQNRSCLKIKSLKLHQQKVLSHKAIQLMATLAIVTMPFGCAMAPKSESPSSASRQGSPAKPRSAPSLDKVKLAKQLGLFKDKTDIGFKQITFNDCSIPRTFRKNSQCSTQFLAMINFRMRCRDSEGTVEQQVTNYELTPLTSNSVKWELGSLNGYTKTDSRGFGQVFVRSWSRVDNQQFRLTANGQIMGVSAKQVRQFVLPRYWCN
jgi:hypothetical protein